MEKIPPSRITPPQAPITPKQAGKAEERKVQQQPQQASSKNAAMPLDSHAMAVRLAALATEAKEKELSMAKIIERAIEETGMTNPQAAMEEVNKRMQKEIEEILDTIKSNKELMEQAEAWQALGDLLEHSMTKGQAEAFIQLVEAQIKAMK